MPANAWFTLAFAALFPLSLLFPIGPPWSWGCVVLGSIWAPGYALLAAVYPRGRCVGLERHALATGLGLVLLPVLALVTSAVLGFHRESLVLVLVVFVALGVLVALVHGRNVASEDAGYSRVPSTRVTLALCGVTFLLAGIIHWWPDPTSEVPAALWLEDHDGQALVLPATVARNTTLAVQVVLAAGHSPLEGTLWITWDGEGQASSIRLDPREHHTSTFQIPTEALGLHAFSARVDAPGVMREVHFQLYVGGP